jgi:uncharacterized protein YbaR (Trm112 family)
MAPQICIFCPDCRGRFFLDKSDIVEEDILECNLCSAEIEILQENPVKIRLVQDEY